MSKSVYGEGDAGVPGAGAAREGGQGRDRDSTQGYSGNDLRVFGHTVCPRGSDPYYSYYIK